MAIFLMWLGVEANYNPELNLLNMHKQAAYTSMAIGIAMFATATFGWTAAATKNECLAFGVSNTIPITLRLLTGSLSLYSSVIWQLSASLSAPLSASASWLRSLCFSINSTRAAS